MNDQVREKVDRLDRSIMEQGEPPVRSTECSALAWTHTKPTIGGLYLLREGPMTTPTMHHLVRNSETQKMNILDTDSTYTLDDAEDLHADYEWYGPIPWE